MHVYKYIFDNRLPYFWRMIHGRIECLKTVQFGVQRELGIVEIIKCKVVRHGEIRTIYVQDETDRGVKYFVKSPAEMVQDYKIKPYELLEEKDIHFHSQLYNDSILRPIQSQEMFVKLNDYTNRCKGNPKEVFENALDASVAKSKARSQAYAQTDFLLGFVDYIADKSKAEVMPNRFENEPNPEINAYLIQNGFALNVGNWQFEKGEKIVPYDCLFNEMQVFTEKYT